MLSAVAISGSPSRDSRSRRLLAHASARLDAVGLRTTAIDLCDLPADDLLGRARSNAVVSALDALAGASLVIVGTPVYRATSSRRTRSRGRSASASRPAAAWPISS